MILLLESHEMSQGRSSEFIKHFSDPCIQDQESLKFSQKKVDFCPACTRSDQSHPRTMWNKASSGYLCLSLQALQNNLTTYSPKLFHCWFFVLMQKIPMELSWFPVLYMDMLVCSLSRVQN